MAVSLFSVNWYRNAQLKPMMLNSVVVKRQHWRKEL